MQVRFAKERITRILREDAGPDKVVRELPRDHAITGQTVDLEND